MMTSLAIEMRGCDEVMCWCIIRLGKSFSPCGEGNQWLPQWTRSKRMMASAVSLIAKERLQQNCLKKCYPSEEAFQFGRIDVFQKMMWLDQVFVTCQTIWCIAVIAYFIILPSRNASLCIHLPSDQTWMSICGLVCMLSDFLLSYLFEYHEFGLHALMIAW